MPSEAHVNAGFIHRTLQDQPKESIMTHGMLAWVLCLPYLINLVFNIYAAMYWSSALGGMLVRMWGVLVGFPIALVALIIPQVARSTFRKWLERHYIAVSLLGLGYFTVLLGLHPFREWTLNYALGDYFKSVVPFAVLALLLVGFRPDKFAVRLIPTYVTVLWVVALIGAGWKLWFVANGKLYGAGLHQYDMGGTLLVIVFLDVVHGNRKRGKKLSKGIVTSMMALLSVLSLKREIWITLAITLFAAMSLSTKKIRVTLVVLGITFTCLALLIQLGYVDSIVSRFNYTFSGQMGLDDSTYTRISESRSSMFSLRDHGNPLLYLVGLGHGAEFVSDPDYPMLRSQTGSAIGLYHHIHNTYSLLMFRYGVLGLAIYLALLWPLGVMWGSSLEPAFRQFALSDEFGQVYLSILISCSILPIKMVASNRMYGNVLFSLDLYVLIAAYYATKSRFEQQRLQQADEQLASLSK